MYAGVNVGGWRHSGCVTPPAAMYIEVESHIFVFVFVCFVVRKFSDFVYLAIYGQIILSGIPDFCTAVLNPLR